MSGDGKTARNIDIPEPTIILCFYYVSPKKSSDLQSNLSSYSFKGRFRVAMKLPRRSWRRGDQDDGEVDQPNHAADVRR